VKLPSQCMKKKMSGIAADSARNIKTAQNSKKETVGGGVKEKKISEKTRRFGEFDEERKCKHFDGRQPLHCSENQNCKASVKDTLKKHTIVDVNAHQKQQDIQTKKFDHDSDLLKEHSVPYSTESVKKRKICDTDRKGDESFVDTKLYEDGLLMCQKKGNSRGLQHCNKKEQRDSNDKVRSLEGRLKANEKVVRMSNIEVKTETSGTADRDGSRAVVDKHCSARKSGHSRDSARQHVRHGLYRALSSR